MNKNILNSINIIEHMAEKEKKRILKEYNKYVNKFKKYDGKIFTCKEILESKNDLLLIEDKMRNFRFFITKNKDNSTIQSFFENTYGNSLTINDVMDVVKQLYADFKSELYPTDKMIFRKLSNKIKRRLCHNQNKELEDKTMNLDLTDELSNGEGINDVIDNFISHTNMNLSQEQQFIKNTDDIYNNFEEDLVIITSDFLLKSFKNTLNLKIGDDYPKIDNDNPIYIFLSDYLRAECFLDSLQDEEK